MRTVLTLVALAACGSKPSSLGPGGVTAVDLPVAPPYATPGERMTFRVQLKGVELAAMTFGAGEITELFGKRVLVVQGHAKSVGLANLVAAVNDVFTSWIDVETGRSLRWQSDEFATGSKSNVEHTVADLHAREGEMIPVAFSVNEGPPTAEPQKVTYPVTWDYNAFLIALRGWEGPAGSKASVEVFRSRWMWHIDVTIRGKETLRTELGELPALRFDARSRKLDRAGGRYPNQDEREFSVWISDDDDRVPLQLTAFTDYGSMKMQIVDYTPGSGPRLRP